MFVVNIFLTIKILNSEPKNKHFLREALELASIVEPWNSCFNEMIFEYINCGNA